MILSNSEILLSEASTDCAALSVVILLDSVAAAAVTSVDSKPWRSSVRLIAELASASAVLLSCVSRTPISDCASEIWSADASSASSELFTAVVRAVGSVVYSAVIAALMTSAMLVVDPSLSVTDPNTSS